MQIGFTVLVSKRFLLSPQGINAMQGTEQHLHYSPKVNLSISIRNYLVHLLGALPYARVHFNVLHKKRGSGKIKVFLMYLEDNRSLTERP